jgi:hypothetical protein
MAARHAVVDQVRYLERRGEYESYDDACNLARDLYGLGRYSESLETINQVLPQQVVLHGSGHESVLQSTRLLAINLRRVGRRREGVELTRDNFRASDRMVGPNHENTLLSMMSYAKRVAVRR